VRRAGRHVGGIKRLAVERIAGLAGLDPCAARHRAGIEGHAADCATGIAVWHLLHEGVCALAASRAYTASLSS
jgi:hypothetical protein